MIRNYLCHLNFELTIEGDKITPTVPGDKVTVKDPSHLTDDEKNQVKNNVDNANKDKFP